VAFDKIKEYSVSPPVLRAPKVGRSFRLYITAKEKMIGAALTQEDGDKEFTVSYVS
jgi:hypothetical protein